MFFINSKWNKNKFKHLARLDETKLIVSSFNKWTSFDSTQFCCAPNDGIAFLLFPSQKFLSFFKMFTYEKKLFFWERYSLNIWTHRTAWSTKTCNYTNIIMNRLVLNLCHIFLYVLKYLEGNPHNLTYFGKAEFGISFIIQIKVSHLKIEFW